jgi:hypothetical protein
VKRSFTSIIASLALAAAILVVPGANPAAAAPGVECARGPGGWACLETGYGPVTICVFANNASDGKAGSVSLLTHHGNSLTDYFPIDTAACCVRPVRATDGVSAYVAKCHWVLKTDLGRMWWGIQYRTRGSGPTAIPEGRFGAVDARGIFHPTGGWLPLRWTSRDPWL